MVTADESFERHLHKMLHGWNEQGPGGLRERPGGYGRGWRCLSPRPEPLSRGTRRQRGSDAKLLPQATRRGRTTQPLRPLSLRRGRLATRGRPPRPPRSPKATRRGTRRRRGAKRKARRFPRFETSTPRPTRASSLLVTRRQSRSAKRTGSTGWKGILLPPPVSLRRTSQPPARLPSQGPLCLRPPLARPSRSVSRLPQDTDPPSLPPPRRLPLRWQLSRPPPFPPGAPSPSPSSSSRSLSVPSPETTPAHSIPSVPWGSTSQSPTPR